jgi:hypothetical protein
MDRFYFANFSSFTLNFFKQLFKTMEIYVLGTGPSLQDFINSAPVECTTIGVNDIWAYYPADYVVCVDKPHRFTPERLEVIKNGKQKEFISPYEWREIARNFNQTALSPDGRGGLKHLDNPQYLTYSVNSAYSAAVKAYHKGASEIILYGVDFIGHHALKDKLAELSVKHFIELASALRRKSCKLFIGSGRTALSGHLPLKKQP